MHFFVRNRATGACTHAGVLEFTAEEGRCYAPAWMHAQLGLAEGGVAEVAYTVLPRATFLRLQPRTSAFLDISDHRAVLEYVMTSYAAATVGDELVLHYNRRDYVLAVREVRPDVAQHAVSLVETNVAIDFDPPADAAEKQKQQQAALPAPTAAAAAASSSPPPSSQSDAPAAEAAATAEEAAGFVPFGGQGRRLDGRTAQPRKQRPQPSQRPQQQQQQQQQPDSDDSFVPFVGHAYTLSGATPSSSVAASSASSLPPPAATQQQSPRKKKRFVAFGGEGHTLQ